MAPPRYWYKGGRKGGITTLHNDRVLHRLDGPAAIYWNGSEEWYKDGELHRLDGPARDSSNWFVNDQEWWVDGKQIKCISNNQFLRLMKLKAFL